jgi:uncharacterized protein (TIGR02453 family)
MAFQGWPAEALEFFEGLEADNSRTYWQQHRADYETLVRAPMEALLAELAPAWGEGRIFRPYRDVRFSADKRPYQTHIGALVGDAYVRLDARGLGGGAGMWEMAPDQLERYRRAVDDDASGGALAGIVAELRAAGIEAQGHGVLKTAPRGYPRDHPRVELLRYKGLVAWQEWPAGRWLGTRRAKDRVVRFLERSRPLTGWLGANVGPSDLPPQRRRG